MQHRRVLPRRTGGPRPRVVRLVSKPTQRDERLDLVVRGYRIEPSVLIVGDQLVLDVFLAAALPVHRIQECVDEHVAPVDTELREETLEALTRLADQDPPSNGLVLRRILSDDKDARTPIEAAAVEDRTPFSPERACR